MEYFKQTITSIVESHGESIEDEDLYLDIESGSEAIEDLSIERHDGELIVCQYYIQRGDYMRDPEVRFRIEDDGEWIPVRFRSDPNTYQFSFQGLEITSFLKTWAVKLEGQFL